MSDVTKDNPFYIENKEKLDKVGSGMCLAKWTQVTLQLQTGHAIDNRVFLNDKFLSKNPQFKSIFRTLNDVETIEKIFDINLVNCSPRPELIDDRCPFFHEVHRDHPDKVLTMLIYIDKDDEQNLASDLYIDKNTHHTKLKWKDNGGIGWTIEPNDDKWHGFRPMEYKGVRRILIINWVKNHKWNDKSQLYLSHRNREFTFDSKNL